MNRYIINHNIQGYETVEIDNKILLNNNNIIVVALDESTNDKLAIYYNSIIDIILSGAKVIILDIAKTSKIRKAIFMVSILYKNYNIYRVDSLGIVDSNYLQAIENREPDIIEVQQFVGGDVAAYSDLSTILFGITQLTNTGDIEGLKVFVEQHIESIENSIELIEYLKRVADSSNSEELISIVNNLKEKIEKSSEEIDRLNSDVRQYKSDNAKLNDKLISMDKELQIANRRASDLTEQLKSNTSARVISTYQELNTSLINCKTTHIIYFKEVSYVKYTNSLVMNMFEMLKKYYKDRVKLLIYDNKVGIPGIYKGVSIYNSSEYLSNRQKILRDTKKLVVAEPNIVFLDDALTSVDPIFETVIVYDRMGQSNNLIVGNNVTKIVVVNSKSMLNNVKDSLKLNINSIIISGDDFGDNSIQIGEIDGYKNATDSAKTSKYFKLPIKEGSKEMIIPTIFAKARIKINFAN